MDLACKFSISLRCRHFLRECGLVQEAANPIDVWWFVIDGRLAGKRELKITNAMSSQASGNSYCCIDCQAADVMHWVVTFKCIAGDVINALSSERFAKLPRKSDEEIKLVIENGRVRLSVSEATINAAAFRASLVKNPGG